MSISVVIPTTRPDHLPGTLASLRVQTVSPHEIIVIDDAAHALGAAAARNKGVAQATGDVVAFIDDDCVAACDWLESLTRTFEDAKIQAASGAVIYRWNGYRPTHSERAVQNQDASWFMGANCAVRREILIKVGGFPENYRRYQDKALALRLWSEGVAVERTPTARVYHSASYWNEELMESLCDSLAYWLQMRAEFDVWADKNNPPPIALGHILMPRDFGSIVHHGLRVHDAASRMRAKLLVRQRLHLWRQAFKQRIFLI